MRRHKIFLLIAMAWMAISLAFAPVIVAATHSPTLLPLSEDSAAHGHAHDSSGDLWPSDHDPMDHEHQLAAILAPAAENYGGFFRDVFPSKAMIGKGAEFPRPRKPPRLQIRRNSAF